MKTRIVHTKIWFDEWFANASRDARELFYFLITCPNINLSGVFEIQDREIIFCTKLDSLDAAKEELSNSGKAIFYRNFVYIPNAARLGGYKGSKNEKARENEIKKLPDEIRLFFFPKTIAKSDRVSIPYAYSSDSTINSKYKIINNKSKIENNKLTNEKSEFNDDVSMHPDYEQINEEIYESNTIEV